MRGLRRFLRVHADAELRASDKLARDRHGHSVQCVEKVLRQCSFVGTIRSLLQMRVEPNLISGGDALNKRFSYQFLGAGMEIAVHTMPFSGAPATELPGKADFSAARPR